MANRASEERGEASAIFAECAQTNHTPDSQRALPMPRQILQPRFRSFCEALPTPV